MAVHSIQDSDALLLYKVGPVIVCSPTMVVETVIVPPQLTAVPGSSLDEPGVFKFIHGMVRVVDLRERFGVELEDRRTPGKIIISEVEGGYAGFWVDEIEDVIKFPDKGWGQVPAYIPREVFKRTLIKEKSIRLYADFEDLDKFKSTGYLRKHIEMIRQAEKKQLVDLNVNKKTNRDAESLATVRESIKQTEDSEHIKPEDRVAINKDNQKKPHAGKSLEKPQNKESNAQNIKASKPAAFHSAPVKPASDKARIDNKVISKKISTPSKADAPLNAQIESPVKPQGGYKKTYVNNSVGDGGKLSTVDNKSQFEYKQDNSLIWLSGVAILILAGLIIGIQFQDFSSQKKTSELTQLRKTFKKENFVIEEKQEVSHKESIQSEAIKKQMHEAEPLDNEIEAVETNNELDSRRGQNDIGKNDELDLKEGQVEIAKNDQGVVIVINDYDFKDDEVAESGLDDQGSETGTIENTISENNLNEDSELHSDISETKIATDIESKNNENEAVVTDSDEIIEGHRDTSDEEAVKENDLGLKEDIDETREEIKLREEDRKEFIEEVADSSIESANSRDEVVLDLVEKGQDGNDKINRQVEEDKRSSIKVIGSKKTPGKKEVPTVKTRRYVHVVVKGDTLWHIAKRYVHNPWRYPELARLSKIKNPDLIYPGNKVIIIINYK